jgi:hypothetical protein
MKGLKWGVPIGSVIMTLAIGPQPYWHDNPPTPWWLATVIGYLLPIVAGVVAGVITRGSWRKDILAGVLCAIPATVVYWLALDVANIGDGIIAPVMLLFAAALGAIGGLIGYPMRRPKAQHQ